MMSLFIGLIILSGAFATMVVGAILFFGWLIAGGRVVVPLLALGLFLAGVVVVLTMMYDIIHYVRGRRNGTLDEFDEIWERTMSLSFWAMMTTRTATATPRTVPPPRLPVGTALRNPAAA